MPLFLGVPLWIWATGAFVAAGGTTAVVIDQAGDAAEQTGDAAARSANLVKWAVVGGALYVSYRAMKSAGAIK